MLRNENILLFVFPQMTSVQLMGFKKTQSIWLKEGELIYVKLVMNMTLDMQAPQIRNLGLFTNMVLTWISVWNKWLH